MIMETKGLRVDLSNAKWTKSPLSSGNGNCVEVAHVDGAFAVRDSKNPSQTPLIFTADEWDAFIGGAKGGAFDRL